MNRSVSLAVAVEFRFNKAGGAISWPPENLLIELLTSIVTTVNVNTSDQEQETL